MRGTVLKSSALGRFLDRTLLVLAAFGVAVVLLTWMIAARRIFGMTREWHFFVGGVLVYNGTVGYLLWDKLVRRRFRLRVRAFAAIIVQVPVLMFFIVFRSGMTAMPQSIAPYVLGSVVLAPLVSVGIEYLFKRTR